MRRGLLVAAVAAVVGGVAPVGAQEPEEVPAPDRYDIAGGCWDVDGHALRLQATDLGRYLLVRPDGRFVGADGILVAPGPDAEWEAIDQPGGVVLRHEEGARLSVGPPAAGCATLPDIDTGVSGPHRARGHLAACRQLVAPSGDALG